MNVKFYKLHVCGDDRILYDGITREGGRQPDFVKLSSLILKRHRGVGAAGFISIEASGTPSDTPWIRAWNRQGDAVPIGPVDAICAARYLFDSGRVSSERISIRTSEGDIDVDTVSSKLFAASMRAPISPGGEVIGANDGQRFARAISVGDRSLRIIPVCAGSYPFAVVFAGSSPTDRAPPFKATEDGMTAISARVLNRSWIRASGKVTDACAMACAVTVAASSCAWTNRECTVDFRSSPDSSEVIYVKWLDDGRLYAAAQAHYCYSGEFWFADSAES